MRQDVPRERRPGHRYVGSLLVPVVKPGAPGPVVRAGAARRRPLGTSVVVARPVVGVTVARCALHTAGPRHRRPHGPPAARACAPDSGRLGRALAAHGRTVRRRHRGPRGRRERRSTSSSPRCSSGCSTASTSPSSSLQRVDLERIVGARCSTGWTSPRSCSSAWTSAASSTERSTRSTSTTSSARARRPREHRRGVIDDVDLPEIIRDLDHRRRGRGRRRHASSRGRGDGFVNRPSTGSCLRRKRRTAPAGASLDEDTTPVRRATGGTPSASRRRAAAARASPSAGARAPRRTRRGARCRRHRRRHRRGETRA